MIRLIAFLPIYGFCIIASLISPYIGLLSFSWLAYMRPQSMLWDVGSDWRISYVVAIALIIGFLFKKNKETLFVKTRENYTLVALWAVIAITTFFSIWPFQSYPKLLELSKIFLIAIFTGGLINTKKRFRYLSFVIALSLSYYGVKGAIHALLFGIQLHGPLNSMIEDNNDFALALVMILPFIFYLGKSERTKFKKFFFYFQFPFMILATIYTYSRGGFLGLCAVLCLLGVRSKHKAFTFFVLIIGIIMFFLFIPQQYKERIQTIKTYEQDESAMARVYSWQAAWLMAKDKPLTGVGLRNYVLVYPSYHWSKPYVAHNSYLQLLAESGFIALGMFLLLLVLAIMKLRKLRKLVSKKPGNEWLHNYSNMLEISIIGYMVSGFFLSRQDFDLLYQIIGMVVALEYIAKNEKLIRA